MHERIIFPNMSTEIGAKCGLIAPMKRRSSSLKPRQKPAGPFEMIDAVNPHYERVIEIDVTDIGPQVACHPDVDHVQAVGTGGRLADR